MRLSVPVVALLLVCPSLLCAQDAEGSKDHPLVPRLAGGQYSIASYDEQGFGTHSFPIRDGNKDVEGKYTKIDYALKEGGKKFGPLEIVRNYRNAFLQKKGEVVFEQASSGGGSATFKLNVSGHDVWLDVEVANSGEMYSLIVVEEVPMTQNVELTSGAMSAALASSGMVTVRGILFDTAKSTIKAESAPVLAEIAKVLDEDGDLKLEIQGHTDNAGTSAVNLTLSRQRADAVKAWLVSKHSIDAGRLTTTGLGDTKPVGDNKTEEGRAQNRRVELVKK